MPNSLRYHFNLISPKKEVWEKLTKDFKTSEAGSKLWKMLLFEIG